MRPPAYCSRSLWVFAAFFLATAACDLKHPFSVTAERVISLDGLKLISEPPDTGKAFGSEAYRVASGRRLLMRFEGLATRAMGIDLSNGKRALLTLRCKPGECVEQANDALKICPVVRNWMMLATWTQAHPFGDGNWAQPGGDYDEPSCIAPHEEEAASRSNDPELLRFDITNHIIDYTQGRRTNYGWILISDDELTIYGETSGPFSPRLTFDEFI